MNVADALMDLSLKNTEQAKEALRNLLGSPDMHATKIFLFLRRCIGVTTVTLPYSLPYRQVCHTILCMANLCHTLKGLPYTEEMYGKRMANLVYGKLECMANCMANCL